MKTKVYSFKPKGRGSVYATSTSHARRGMGSSTSKAGKSKRFGGVVSGIVSDTLARVIVRGIFGIK